MEGMEKIPPYSQAVLKKLGIPEGILTEREVFILALRMGFVDGKEHTLLEVARFFGTLPARIELLEETALKKVKAYKEKEDNERDKP